MNWYKKSQEEQKDMALPAAVPENYIGFSGVDRLNRRMPEEIARSESSKYPGMQFLGAGGIGTAYDIGNGQVIKYTTDEYEAKSAINIQHCQEQGGCGWAAKVHYVNRVFQKPLDPVNPYDTQEHIYAIIMEKLQLLDEIESRIIKDLNYDSFRLAHANEDTVNNIVNKKVNLFTKFDMDAQQIETIVRQFIAFVQNLVQDGADIGDVKPTNMGKKTDGNYAMLDLGFLLG